MAKRANALRSVNSVLNNKEGESPALRFNTGVIQDGSPLDEKKEETVSPALDEAEEAAKAESPKQPESKTDTKQNASETAVVEKKRGRKKKATETIPKTISCQTNIAKLLDVAVLLHKDITQSDIINIAVEEYLRKEYPDVITAAKSLYPEL